jgi:hypothetical protein
MGATLPEAGAFARTVPLQQGHGCDPRVIVLSTTMLRSCQAEVNLGATNWRQSNNVT